MDTVPTRAPFTAAEITAWLVNWVASAAGIAEGDVDVDTPMQNLGLSSRDAVIMSGELENLVGIKLDPTVAYEHPTIAALSAFIAGGAGNTPAGNPSHTGTWGENRGGGFASTPGRHDIAIVGMAARYPGGEDLDSLWDLLVAGRSGVGDLPIGRWSEYASDPVMARKMENVNTTGGYLSDIGSFDAEFFGISPVEAANMDPQQRIMLELAWEALDHARIPADSLKGSSTGVFVGSSNNDYGMLIAADPAEAHPYALTGTASSIVANRISYALDLRGPSVQVDTACSSSLVAIHSAVRALRCGDADVALAGGVNILASPFVSTAFGELGVISPSGAIHAFSDDADGFVRGDGAGLVVLKRVDDAIADGDEIWAVIRGTAVNSDGRSNGLTAPNPDAQVDVLRRAYQDAGVDPTLVDVVEAHGTGTILGDPIEASALGEVLGAGRDIAAPVLLGSAKTNFGHTESAAGAAGVIKTVLAMRHGVVPPSINYSGPNPYIDFDANHLEVVEDPREWPRYCGLMTAGVSGFGFGGTNAHAVIQEFDPGRYDTAIAANMSAGGAVDDDREENDNSAAYDLLSPQSVDESGRVRLAVSGLLPSRRRAYARALVEHLREQGATVDLAGVARSLARRNHGRSAAVVTATSVEEAITRLGYVADGKRAQGIISADSPDAAGPVFVYSGFGSQHRKMAKELYGLSPVFRRRVDALDAIVTFESGWSLVDLITDDEQTYDTETAQVGITVIQIALTDLLAHMGVKPAAVTAMSMGEIAAAYAAGGLSAEDAVRIACQRSRLMGEGEKSLPEDQLGAMAVVELSADDLDRVIAGDLAEVGLSIPTPGDSAGDDNASDDNAEDDRRWEFTGVEPAVYAGPGMTTVGGPRPQVTALVELLEANGKFARLLNVKGAGHTSAVDPLLGELVAETAGITPTPLTVPLYSSVDKGRIYQPGEIVHDTDYWVRCTRGRVWFLDACTQVFAAGHQTLVEICPNPVAIMGLMNTAFACGKPDAHLLFTLKRKVPAAETLGDVLAQLYVDGVAVDLTQLVPSGEYATIPAPVWKKQRYWTAARPSSSSTPALPGHAVALPDGSTAFSTLAELAPSTLAVLEAAAEAVNPEAKITACEEQSTLPITGEITTIAKKTLGGIIVSVYRVPAGGDTPVLLAEGFATTTGTAAAGNVNVAGGLTTTEHAADPVDTGLPEINTDAVRWDPSTGETVEQRLKTIVSESMGYDVEDLPGELPLIDLGLDSLMGMRIKNRVENDFQIPPLQVQALRDASVADVVALVEQMVADRGCAAEDTAGQAADVVSDAGEKSAPSGTETGTESGVGVAAATESAADADAAAVAPGQRTESSAPAAEPTGVGVAPRDASERLVFATWATITGAAAAGVTSPLPAIDGDTAQAIAERLSERSGASITADDVSAASTLEPLATMVREVLETDVDGTIRVLRERAEGSRKPALFMFHPAGGSSVVYQPLTRRLPEDQPVYGVERLEGTLQERAAVYVDDIIARADGHPVVLGGWSFGGALAYEVAHQLVGRDVDLRFIALLDTVQPAETIPDTPEETRARWERYSAFAKKTYGLDFPVPYELLESAGEDALLDMMAQFLATTDASEHGLSAGVLEHQRASFVDNRILARVDLSRWADVSVPVVLFRAERMHDGAIELEPRYADIAPDGGWSAIVEDLDIVQLHGDHLAVVDEPEIATVAAYLRRRIDADSVA